MASASSGAVQRPTFFEGQIIAAADLNATVESARVGLAQHERYLHLPGIAEGLKLAATERQTLSGDTYQDVTVTPGLAVDGNGRHLSLTEAERLSEDVFDQANVAISDPAARYPVFLIGRDDIPVTSGAPQLACYGNAPTRVIEIADIGFGRVDEAADPHNIATDDIAAGPDAEGAPWRVLLGFVQWNAAIKRFASIADQSDGVGRAYVGVRADEVVAKGGRLALRSAAKGENGKAVVEIDGSADGELRFGAQNSSGTVVPVFTVNAKGDVFAAGKIAGAEGGPQFQSGSAFDGTLLPLPPGVTADQVAQGKVTVHAQVTLHLGASIFPPLPLAPPLGAGHRWLMSPIECRVDEDRRVHCRVVWTRTDAAAPPQIRLGVCDYTLTALVAA
jgi:hypothetical protein